MPATQEQIESVIKQSLDGAEVSISALAGDNDHWSVLVKWVGFSGKSRIEQHKLVQKTLMPLNIHAVEIKTAL